MAPPTLVTSETTALLGDSQPAGESGGGPARKRFTFSPETLLIPVALATRLASMVPLTTLIELIRRAICRLWNISHGDPTTLPVGGPNTKLCDAPEISKDFATVIAILSAVEGIISIAECGALSSISSRYGRKLAFSLVLLLGIVGNSMILGSQYTPDWLTDWVLLVGLLFNLSSGALPYTYLINTYIVDVSVPENRTAALSQITGWASVGTCISLALGGVVTTKTGNPTIVFCMAVAIYIATLIYTTLFLPESFPEEKRKALACIPPEPSTDGRTISTRFAALQIFEPLKMLMPTRRPDGTYNWRLTWCGIHSLLCMTATGYASAAWLVLVTSKYHFTPADTGLFLTIASVSSTTVLTVIVPPLVRFLHPYYPRRSHLPQGDIATHEGLELETSDRLDVHLAFASCVVAGVFYLSAAASTTSQAMIFSAICLGFVLVHGPATRSLVAASVDPLKQGEALAAIEMASNTGNFLSPIIMGSILSATIGTTPLLMFYVHLVVVLVSGALLFLVRDADRYQKPHEA